MSDGAEGAFPIREFQRCVTTAFNTVRSRPAKVGDKLTTRDFGTCTRGFAAAEDARCGGLRSSGNRACVFRPGDSRIALPSWRVETLGSRDGNLPTS